MDRQRIFDEAFLGIYAQGKRAYSGGRCQYRASDGSQCAIGILMTPAQAAELPNEGISKDVVWGLAGDFLIPKYGEPDDEESDLDFLVNIQASHDSIYASGPDQFRVAWIANMRNVAVHYELNTAVIDNV